MNNNKKRIFWLILTSLFTALTFSLSYVNIPFPLGGIVHLGNFAAILAALIGGPLCGGISGSLGMGLFDLSAGFPPSTIIRSFILKFIVCYVAGVIFKSIKKNERYSNIFYIIGSFLFLIIGTLTLLPVITNNGNFTFTLGSQTKTMVINILIPIMSYIFTAILIVMIFISNKMSNIAKAASISTTFAILINITFEIILRTLFVGIESGSFEAAFATAITKIPSSIITGIITIIAIAVIFPPLYLAIKNTDIIKEIENDNLFL